MIVTDLGTIKKRTTTEGYALFKAHQKEIYNNDIEQCSDTQEFTFDKLQVLQYEYGTGMSAGDIIEEANKVRDSHNELVTLAEKIHGMLKADEWACTHRFPVAVNYDKEQNWLFISGYRGGALSYTSTKSTYFDCYLAAILTQIKHLHDAASCLMNAPVHFEGDELALYIWRSIGERLLPETTPFEVALVEPDYDERTSSYQCINIPELFIDAEDATQRIERFRDIEWYSKVFEVLLLLINPEREYMKRMKEALSNTESIDQLHSLGLSNDEAWDVVTRVNVVRMHLDHVIPALTKWLSEVERFQAWRNRDD